nr:MAG TPA: hypothetical protein [Caudoviricetes sp.]
MRFVIAASVSYSEANCATSSRCPVRVEICRE